MSAHEHRIRWLRLLRSQGGGSDGDTEQVKEELERFVILFDTPEDLVRDALPPIATLLQRHGHTELFEDVLFTFAATTPFQIARGWALVNLADRRISADDYEGAFRLLLEARDLFRSIADAEGLAATLIHLGDVARFSISFASADFDDAIIAGPAIDVGARPLELYSEALSLSQNDSRRQRAHISLADVYLMSGRIDLAVGACREAIAILEPHHDIAHRRWVIREALNLAKRLEQRSYSTEARELAIGCQRLCDTFKVGDSWCEEFEKTISEIMSATRG